MAMDKREPKKHRANDPPMQNALAACDNSLAVVGSRSSENLVKIVVDDKTPDLLDLLYDAAVAALKAGVMVQQTVLL